MTNLIKIVCPLIASSAHRTPVLPESHDRVTWRRLVFIPVVAGRPPDPEWPHHTSHNHLGNGLWSWRYVWGTTLKHFGCLKIKAHRNSPVSKSELSSVLSMVDTPKQDNMCGWQCLVTAAGSLKFISGFYFKWLQLGKYSFNKIVSLLIVKFSSQFYPY